MSIKDKYDYEIYATGARVRTFLPIDDSFWLATLVYPNEREKSNLYKSTNKGKSWKIFNNGYGEGHIINGNTIKLFPDKMEITHSTPQKIYARTTPILNVGRSSDLAQSWESVYHSWEDPFLGNGAFVYINEYDENIVWAGGATTFFSPDLKYSIDSGENWVEVKVYENGDGTVDDVIMNREGIVMAGVSGAIFISNNLGENWELNSNQDYAKVFERSAADENRVYSSGFSPLGILGFMYTENFGDTWQTIEFEDGPSTIVVNDMISVMQNGKEVLYFATNQGVFSYTFEE